MNSKSEYNFADWYRPADSQLTTLIQESRIVAIKVLMENEAQGFWLDVVRLYMGVPMKTASNKAAFIKAFKDADGVFPVSGNEHQLQILAAILLCFRLEAQADVNTLISLAVLNTNFLGQYNEYTAVPVNAFASRYLSETAKNERNADLSDNTDEVNELSGRIEEDDYEFDSADHTVNTNAIAAILHSQKVLSEETNILWWLFGEGSVSLNESFKNIGLPKAIGIIPKELFDLLQFQLGPVKIKSIIQKAIANASSSKTTKAYSAFDVITKLSKNERTVILSNAKPAVEFAPVLSGFYKAVQFETVDWSSIYAGEFQAGDLKKSFQPIELASQIFNELLFLNCLE
jgi:hypothetical protein